MCCCFMGSPKLAYSWRKVMPPLAAAGYHVMAPDMRGFGRTDGTDVDYDDDLGPFRRLNRVLDMVGLVSAFGHRSVDVIGHDAGSPVAVWCAVVRPDIFRSVVLMSARSEEHRRCRSIRRMHRAHPPADLVPAIR